jgi:hypothetical protein
MLTPYTLNYLIKIFDEDDMPVIIIPYFIGSWSEIVNDEPPRRKRRGINRKILTAPRDGELNPRPQAY